MEPASRQPGGGRALRLQLFRSPNHTDTIVQPHPEDELGDGESEPKKPAVKTIASDLFLPSARA
jgi:hypothetical protein